MFEHSPPPLPCEIGTRPRLTSGGTTHTLQTIFITEKLTGRYLFRHFLGTPQNVRRERRLPDTVPQDCTPVRADI